MYQQMDLQSIEVCTKTFIQKRASYGNRLQVLNILKVIQNIYPEESFLRTELQVFDKLKVIHIIFTISSVLLDTKTVLSMYVYVT